jgi:hypothetical protein
MVLTRASRPPRSLSPPSPPGRSGTTKRKLVRPPRQSAHAQPTGLTHRESHGQDSGSTWDAGLH